MADELDRYEWQGQRERWAAVRDARRTGLSITRATLARLLSLTEGWMPEGFGEVALEILRLAARERELLALTGKQHEWLASADHAVDCAAIQPVPDQVADAVLRGEIPCPDPPCTCGLTALLTSLGAQKAAGELERLQKEVDRLSVHAESVLRLGREKQEMRSEAAKLRADNEALRARVRDLESGGLALAEDASRMQARLSRLDGMLASKEPPAELRLFCYNKPGGITDNAWRWLREALGTPTADQEADQHHASVAADLTLRHLLWLRHGCPSHALYGDDGEMSCGQCVIDFLRWSPEQIAARFETIGRQKHQAAPPAEPQTADPEGSCDCRPIPCGFPHMWEGDWCYAHQKPTPCPECPHAEPQEDPMPAPDPPQDEPAAEGQEG